MCVFIYLLPCLYNWSAECSVLPLSCSAAPKDAFSRSAQIWESIYSKPTTSLNDSRPCSHMDVSENREIIHFNGVFHSKPSILGYPYFWKHPYLMNVLWWKREKNVETVVPEVLKGTMTRVQGSRAHIWSHPETLSTVPKENMPRSGWCFFPTHLKKMSQIGHLLHLGVKKKVWNHIYLTDT